MSFADRIEPLLARSVERGEIAGAAVTVESTEGTQYEGAAGHWNLDGTGPAYTAETPLRIASMTKAVTSVATMQLVERGQIDLDEPVSRWLPRLEAPQILGEDRALRTARTPITARHLLTHTSGFGYAIWSEQLTEYVREFPSTPAEIPGAELLDAPLLFEPGTGWHYGISTDWLGELIVAISGQALGAYLEEHLFGPLAMPSTGFRMPEDETRFPLLYERQDDDSLIPRPPQSADNRYESGGAGLRSTPRDYGRFLRMVLGRGALEGSRILEAATVEEMARSHSGDLDVGVLTSASPMSNSDDLSFGHGAGFGLGFLITLGTSRTARTAGSLSWAGMFNSYYWIDLNRDVAGAFYTQVLPFLDRPVVDINREFERATYEALGE